MKKFLLETILTLIITFLLVLAITFFMVVFERSYEEAAINFVLVLIALKYSEKISEKIFGSF
ncbi:hypothetical protein HMPREF1013_00849 [Bacillus sp. 2_A_57_CT2]|nr:hypothetical protein HMPREF1013_00849 [Bacillus sp. 2_A_57_CT2]